MGNQCCNESKQDNELSSFSKKQRMVVSNQLDGNSEARNKPVHTKGKSVEQMNPKSHVVEETMKKLLENEGDIRSKHKNSKFFYFSFFNKFQKKFQINKKSTRRSFKE